MIETEGLTKRFGEHTAVDRLSLTVRDGEVFGLLGPNGAGKTTTIRMLLGLISISSGAARLGGLDVGKPDEALRIRSMVGFLPENVGLYEELSAVANLTFFGRLYDVPTDRVASRIEALLRRLGLWEERGRAVGTYSKGMKQKLAIARALVHDPKILFLDEPTANLDPEATRTVRETIRELRAEGRTVVLTTHNLDEAQRLCDRVAILKTRLVAVGSPQELRQHFPGVRTAVRLEKADDTLLAAVRERLAGRSVERDGPRLLVGVKDPEAENPEIVQAVVGAGGRIRTVEIVEPSLEDAYLGLVQA